MINEIAFIICANDERELEECQHYISKLQVPAGYTVTVLAVWDAESMAGGYQEEMEGSDAKYKVYLHQDVRIVNPKFIFDIISAFARHPDAGMLGVIGTKRVPERTMPVYCWDEGKLVHNLFPQVLDYQGDSKEDTEVALIDGLLMVTAVDVKWRSDLFQGWDFYDISQAMEMHQAGKKVILPYQDKAWCYHDNRVCKMKNYERDFGIFLREYCGDTFSNEEVHKQPLGIKLEFEQLVKQLEDILDNLLENGEKAQFCQVFSREENRKYVALWKYRVIADIEVLEEKVGEKKRFWGRTQGKEEVLENLRILKLLLKRIEYDAEDGWEYRYLEETYSNSATSMMTFECVQDKEKVQEKIAAHRSQI